MTTELPLTDQWDHNPAILKQSDIENTLLGDTFGARRSNLRQQWVDLLSQANTIIAAIQRSYEDVSTDLKESVYPQITSFLNNSAQGFDFSRSNLSSVQKHTVTAGYKDEYTSLFDATRESTKQFMWEIAGPGSRADWRGGTITTLTQIYNAFYYNNYNTPITFLPHGIGTAEYRHKGISTTLFGRALYAVEQEFARREQVIATEVGVAQGDDVAESAAAAAVMTKTVLSPTDIRYLSHNTEYRQYFSTTFNKDAITFVPILQNFYLTGKYFSNVDTAFESTKDRALDILITTILNDDNFDALPNLTRPAAAAAIAEATGADQDPAFSSAGRDFLLKMLLKTPVDILKGLVELIDPHVSISKLIKTGTGFAFNDLATQMDAPAKQINENLKGEDLLKLVLCVVDQSLDAAEGGMPDPPSGTGAQEFFPRISIDGVDFTGTVSGMFMVPPSPLGLIYLLLELLKNEITDAVENVDGASENAAAETECEDEG
tara:strand:- start:797 stop:2266 length:1470 start_codon:yes stop_codon:yes gene_type:complete